MEPTPIKATEPVIFKESQLGGILGEIKTTPDKIFPTLFQIGFVFSPKNHVDRQGW